MVASRSTGFTILETMLFLAITGLLIIGMLTGVGVSINTQRYRDSVQSLKSLFQSQYTQLTDVTNDRNNSWTCNSDAKTTQGAENSGTSRGQSACVILGRYIVIDQDKITTQSVIGYETPSDATGTDIELILANYKLSLATDNPEASTLEWGAKIAWPTDGNGSQPPTVARSIGVLLIRSPDSGTVYTFSVDSPPSLDNTSGDDIAALLVTGDKVSKNYGSSVLRGQNQRTLCIDSNGFLSGGTMAVVLQSFATNNTSVQTMSNDVLQQAGNAEGTKC